MGIHPTAVIDPSAEIDPGASVGPYALIGPRTVVGPDVEIMGHAFIDKDTVIGRGSRIFPFASLGADPQDLKYKGEPTRLILGENVTIRESVTIHRATVEGRGCTEIDDDAFIMSSVHVAHNCRVGRRAILSSFAVLAGHVTIEEDVIVSGLTAIHQFVRVGRHSFVGGMSGPSKDVPPYMLLAGVRDKAAVSSPNVVGLKRRNFPPEVVDALVGAFRLLHNRRPLAQVLDEVDARWPDCQEIRTLTEFYRSSERGVYR
ncbi:MAG: acyl-ACP--UDP-N-acetylglucosamine O-acyltransferase [Deltaproteobacteria bacterium]|jgi:UDP-N-acetylglucosamine acyltransferase|nr:acyl-ACP--UDP-N-acetylglucosamine O-acyltransferase [Deltaproteobacteria bacterium]